MDREIALLVFIANFFVQSLLESARASGAEDIVFSVYQKNTDFYKKYETIDNPNQFCD